MINKTNKKILENRENFHKLAKAEKSLKNDDLQETGSSF